MVLLTINSVDDGHGTRQCDLDRHFGHPLSHFPLLDSEGGFQVILGLDLSLDGGQVSCTSTIPELFVDQVVKVKAFHSSAAMKHNVGH